MTAAAVPAGPGFTRRQVVAGGAALLLAPLLPIGFKWLFDGDESPLSVLHRSDAPRLSVGYVDGSDQVDDLSAWAGGGRSTPASRVQAGTGEAARVSVRGFSPGTSATRADLDALYPAGSALAPFFAYSVRDGKAASNPVEFAVPLGGGPAVALAIGIGAAMAVGKDGTVQPDAEGLPPVAVFTGGSQAGMAKLRRGIYLLGVAPKTWDRRTDVPAADAATWGDKASVIVAVEPEG